MQVQVFALTHLHPRFFCESSCRWASPSVTLPRICKDHIAAFTELSATSSSSDSDEDVPKDAPSPPAAVEVIVRNMDNSAISSTSAAAIDRLVLPDGEGEDLAPPAAKEADRNAAKK